MPVTRSLRPRVRNANGHLNQPPTPARSCSTNRNPQPTPVRRNPHTSNSRQTISRPPSSRQSHNLTADEVRRLLNSPGQDLVSALNHTFQSNARPCVVSSVSNSRRATVHQSPVCLPSSDAHCSVFILCSSPFPNFLALPLHIQSTSHNLTPLTLSPLRRSIHAFVASLPSITRTSPMRAPVTIPRASLTSVRQTSVTIPRPRRTSYSGLTRGRRLA